MRADREWLFKPRRTGGRIAPAWTHSSTPSAQLPVDLLHWFKVQWLISATPALEWAPPTDEKGQGGKEEQEAVTSQLNLPKYLSQDPE